MASVVSVIEGLKQKVNPTLLLPTPRKVPVFPLSRAPEWHHRVPKGEEIALALEELKMSNAEHG